MKTHGDDTQTCVCVLKRGETWILGKTDLISFHSFISSVIFRLSILFKCRTIFFSLSLPLCLIHRLRMQWFFPKHSWNLYVYGAMKWHFKIELQTDERSFVNFSSKFNGHGFGVGYSLCININTQCMSEWIHNEILNLISK